MKKKDTELNGHYCFYKDFTGYNNCYYTIRMQFCLNRRDPCEMSVICWSIAISKICSLCNSHQPQEETGEARRHSERCAGVDAVFLELTDRSDTAEHGTHKPADGVPCPPESHSIDLSLFTGINRQLRFTMCCRGRLLRLLQLK